MPSFFMRCLYGTGILVFGATVFSPPTLAAAAVDPLVIMVDQPPVTLNPRLTFDATGQRLGALLFRGLSRIDENLNAIPDLAESWTVKNSGREWRFKIKKGLRDQAGASIAAPELKACFDAYFNERPSPPLASSFPNWDGVKTDRGDLIVRLKKPDPYLARNLSLVRYFRVDQASPCHIPADREPSAWIGSGAFRPATWDLTPETRIDLISIDRPDRSVRIEFVRDDLSRALRLLRGDVDATQNSLSLAKTRWISQAHGDRYAVIEREGTTVNYLSFNLRDPILKDARVRRAIMLAIDREDIVKHKMFGFGSLASSILSPGLPEYAGAIFAYDPAQAEKLLDQAGYPRGKHGLRFGLEYKTTTAREGQEQALIYQNMLAKVGIHLTLQVVEPAVFLTSVRQGAYQICTSRWIGVADASILFRTLRTGAPDNRAHYQDADMDRLLDRAESEWDEKKRVPLMQEVQRKMAQDLPYLPLFYWSNAVVVKKGLASKIDVGKLSLSGALDSLVYQLTR